jgi:hypothetical protein
MKVKFLRTLKRKDGSINYYIGVPGYVEAATKLKPQSFSTLLEASEYANKVLGRYEASRNTSRKAVTVSTTTVDGLIHNYRTTQDWHNLTINSQKSYDLMIRNAVDLQLPNSNIRFGEMLVRNLTKGHVSKFISRIRQTHSLHRATHCVKVMRLVWSVSEHLDLVQNNPWTRPRIKGIPSRNVLWTDEQFQMFIKRADELDYHSVGTLALMCYHMCQRPGDMRKLTWDKIQDGVCRFHQEKTGTLVEIPLSPALLLRLEKTRKIVRETKEWVKAGRYKVPPYDPQYDNFVLINERSNTPHTRLSYYRYAKRIRRDLKLPDDLRIGDYRRTGATLLAENGCTEDELRSVTGHKSRETLNIYVNPSKRLAKNAIVRVWGDPSLVADNMAKGTPYRIASRNL